MTRHISFITHYDTDGAVSHAIAKKVMMNTYPDAITEYKCCGYGKVSAKIQELAQSGNDIFVATDLMIPKDDMKFIIKHWKQIYYFDHHLESERYQLLADRLGSRMVFRYDVDNSASRIVHEWSVNECHLQQMMQPQWKELVKLTDVYDMWRTDHTDWQMAFDLNELFWSKNFWKFSDRFCDTGFSKFSAYERKRIKELYQSKMKDIERAPKEQLGEEGAFVFLPTAEALNLCTFAFTTSDVFFVVYPHKMGEPDLGLSVRIRDHMFSREYKMNVDELLKKAVLNFPQVFNDAGGHEFAGGAVVYPGVNIEKVREACHSMFKWLTE